MAVNSRDDEIGRPGIDRIGGPFLLLLLPSTGFITFQLIFKFKATKFLTDRVKIGLGRLGAIVLVVVVVCCLIERSLSGREIDFLIR